MSEEQQEDRKIINELEEELSTLKLQMKAMENTWKKEKAILQQSNELQALQIIEAKSREDNLKKMNETFMDTLQALSSESNKFTNKSLKDLKGMLEGINSDNEASKMKRQDLITRLEKENRELKDLLEEKIIELQEAREEAEKNALNLDETIKELAEERTLFQRKENEFKISKEALEKDLQATITEMTNLQENLKRQCSQEIEKNTILNEQRIQHIKELYSKEMHFKDNKQEDNQWSLQSERKLESARKNESYVEDLSLSGHPIYLNEQIQEQIILQNNRHHKELDDQKKIKEELQKKLLEMQEKFKEFQVKNKNSEASIQLMKEKFEKQKIELEEIERLKEKVKTGKEKNQALKEKIRKLESDESNLKEQLKIKDVLLNEERNNFNKIIKTFQEQPHQSFIQQENSQFITENDLSVSQIPQMKGTQHQQQQQQIEQPQQIYQMQQNQQLDISQQKQQQSHLLHIQQQQNPFLQQQQQQQLVFQQMQQMQLAENEVLSQQQSISDDKSNQYQQPHFKSVSESNDNTPIHTFNRSHSAQLRNQNINEPPKKTPSRQLSKNSHSNNQNNNSTNSSHPLAGQIVQRASSRNADSPGKNNGNLNMKQMNGFSSPSSSASLISQSNQYLNYQQQQLQYQQMINSNSSSFLNNQPSGIVNNNQAVGIRSQNQSSFQIGNKNSFISRQGEQMNIIPSNETTMNGMRQNDGYYELPGGQFGTFAPQNMNPNACNPKMFQENNNHYQSTASLPSSQAGFSRGSSERWMSSKGVYNGIDDQKREEIERVINMMEGDIMSLQNENNNLINQICKLKGDINSLQAHNNQLVGQNSLLQGQLNSLQVSNGQLQTQISSFTTQIGSLTTQITSYQKLLSEKEISLEKMTSQMTTKQEEMGDFGKIKQKLEQERDKLQENEVLLKQEIKYLVDKLLKAKEKIEILEGDCNQNQIQNNFTSDKKSDSSSMSGNRENNQSNNVSYQSMGININNLISNNNSSSQLYSQSNFTTNNNSIGNNPNNNNNIKSIPVSGTPSNGGNNNNKSSIQLIKQQILQKQQKQMQQQLQSQQQQPSNNNNNEQDNCFSSDQYPFSRQSVERNIKSDYQQKQQLEQKQQMEYLSQKAFQLTKNALSKNKESSAQSIMTIKAPQIDLSPRIGISKNYQLNQNNLSSGNSNFQNNLFANNNAKTIQQNQNNNQLDTQHNTSCRMPTESTLIKKRDNHSIPLPDSHPNNKSLTTSVAQAQFSQTKESVGQSLCLNGSIKSPGFLNFIHQNKENSSFQTRKSEIMQRSPTSARVQSRTKAPQQQICGNITEVPISDQDNSTAFSGSRPSGSLLRQNPQSIQSNRCDNKTQGSLKSIVSEDKAQQFNRAKTPYTSRFQGQEAQGQLQAESMDLAKRHLFVTKRENSKPIGIGGNNKPQFLYD